MQFPNSIQYKQAVQDPESFATLNNDLHAVMDGYEPVLASGNFAVVFKCFIMAKTCVEMFYQRECRTRRPAKNDC
jgi:hypothetical protein